MTTCSVLYYPGQDTIKIGWMTGHADLEFEGTVYSLSPSCQLEREFSQRIKKAQNGGLPFERLVFQLTPEQSKNLKAILKNGNELLVDVLSGFDESTKARTMSGIRKFSGEKLARLTERIKYNPMIPVGYSCMDMVSNVLDKASIVRIPKIIKLSPLLSSLYLRWRNKEVKEIVPYGDSFSSFKNCLIVNSCRLGEIGLLALPLLAAAYYA